MQRPDGFNTPNRSQLDWRGWIALFWVLWWASAYAVTTFQARSPHVLAWLRTLGN
jgi:hypothetical protein